MSDAPGLRERKKFATMRRIQTVALELFERDGFDAVTIERIAEAAEVSASSVYRYFGTKEMLVIWDEYDPAAVAAVAEELREHPPMEAIRRVFAAAIEEAFAADEERVHLRLRLAYTHPSIEAASAQQAYEMARFIATILAQGTGRPEDDLDVQVFSHALVGGILGAMRHWYLTGFTTDVAEIAERPLAVLEHGLSLS